MNDNTTLENILVDLVTSEAKLDLIGQKFDTILNRAFGSPYGDATENGSPIGFSFIDRLSRFSERLRQIAWKIEDNMTRLDDNIGWEAPIDLPKAGSVSTPLKNTQQSFPAKSARAR